MLNYVLSFLIGIMFFSFKNSIKISSVEMVVFITLFLLIFIFFKQYKKIATSISFFIFGFIWMGFFSYHVLNNQVSQKYLNKPIQIIGKISSLPRVSAQNTKFIFTTSEPFIAKIKLSWYANKKQLQTGDTWQLYVKLKKNNSYQNYQSFDYEKYLFYQKIDATGYVKTSKINQLINVQDDFSINKWRQQIRNSIDKFLTKLEFGAIINALVIGDKSLISKEKWELFRATNTTHLIVISGLHIGIISGFIFLIISKLWSMCYFCTLRIPAQIIASYFGIFSAGLYTLIAGFSIPTQRAFIMASVYFLAIIFRRHHNRWQLYALALFLVLIFNPLSVFDAGFWLSFYVVAIIIYTLEVYKNKHWLYQSIILQLAISIATFPLVAWFFKMGSILSPIANMSAIPIFSFIIVPFSLIGALFAPVNDFIANLFFISANKVLVYLSDFLLFLKNISFNKWQYTPSSIIELILILISIFLIIVKKIKIKIISIGLLFLTLLFPYQLLSQNSVKISVFDVGQGLAILAQTQNHTLLYDTGSYFSSGFNMGDAVIIPQLIAKNINQLDKIIISHADNDHIGSLKTILKKIQATEIISSSDISKINNTKCDQQKSWNWDGVIFNILGKNKHLNKNNNSCVVKISTGKYSILLTGDIEKKTEKYLVNTLDKKLQSNVLIAPHHGSKTSSSIDFLHKVKPELVIISSGFKNRFNHPASEVINRYKQMQIKTLNTACSGQIDITLGENILINQYRKEFGKYYTRQCL